MAVDAALIRLQYDSRACVVDVRPCVCTSGPIKRTQGRWASLVRPWWNMPSTLENPSCKFTTWRYESSDFSGMSRGLWIWFVLFLSQGYFLLKFLADEVGEENFLLFFKAFVRKFHGRLILSQVRALRPLLLTERKCCRCIFWRSFQSHVIPSASASERTHRFHRLDLRRGCLAHSCTKYQMLCLKLKWCFLTFLNCIKTHKMQIWNSSLNIFSNKNKFLKINLWMRLVQRRLCVGLLMICYWKKCTNRI